MAALGTQRGAEDEAVALDDFQKGFADRRDLVQDNGVHHFHNGVRITVVHLQEVLQQVLKFRVHVEHLTLVPLARKPREIRVGGGKHQRRSCSSGLLF